MPSQNKGSTVWFKERTQNAHTHTHTAERKMNPHDVTAPPGCKHKVHTLSRECVCTCRLHANNMHHWSTQRDKRVLDCPRLHMWGTALLHPFIHSYASVDVSTATVRCVAIEDTEGWCLWLLVRHVGETHRRLRRSDSETQDARLMLAYEVQ